MRRFQWDASKIDESTGSHFQRVANTLSETDGNGKNVLSFVGGFFAPIASPVSPGKDDATLLCRPEQRGLSEQRVL